MTVEARSESQISHVALEEASELDRLVFSADPYALPAARQDELRLGLVRSAVERQLELCPPYAAFAARAGFSPEVLREPADLALVPQLPTGLFKRTEVRSVPRREIAKRCVSSGTRGRQSVVWRDRITLERLLGSVRVGIGFVSKWFEDEVEILNLGPPSEEAGDLWFAYVMSLIEVVYPTRHLVRDEKLDLDRAAQLLAAALDEHEAVGVMGPPALVLRLAERMAADGGLDGGERLHVITGGGWKRDLDRSVDRGGFAAAVGEAFGLAEPAQLRDGFNQVELNSILLECERGRMHVPPWLEVVVREPRGLEPVAAGEEGLLSFLDPTAESYPAFIVGDDVGVLGAEPCACGRHGRWVRFLRRLERDEQHGCGLKMSRDFDPGEADNGAAG